MSQNKFHPSWTYVRKTEVPWGWFKTPQDLSVSVAVQTVPVFLGLDISSASRNGWGAWSAFSKSFRRLQILELSLQIYFFTVRIQSIYFPFPEVKFTLTEIFCVRSFLSRDSSVSNNVPYNCAVQNFPTLCSLPDFLLNINLGFSRVRSIQTRRRYHPFSLISIDLQLFGKFRNRTDCYTSMHFRSDKATLPWSNVRRALWVFSTLVVAMARRPAYGITQNSSHSSRCNCFVCYILVQITKG